MLRSFLFRITTDWSFFKNHHLLLRRFNDCPIVESVSACVCPSFLLLLLRIHFLLIQHRLVQFLLLLRRFGVKRSLLLHDLNQGLRLLRLWRLLEHFGTCTDTLLVRSTFLISTLELCEEIVDVGLLVALGGASLILLWNLAHALLSWLVV